jgi:hypothetical protein
MPSTKKYLLVATCLKCGFSMSNQVEIEPTNLTKARVDFAKLVVSTHGEHPDLNNFDVSANEQ